MTIVVLRAPALASGGINDNGENGGVILFVVGTFEVGLVGRVPCSSSVSFHNFCFKMFKSTSFASVVSCFYLIFVKRLLYSLLKTGIFDLLAAVTLVAPLLSGAKIESGIQSKNATHPPGYIGVSAIRYIDVPPSQRSSVQRRLLQFVSFDSNMSNNINIAVKLTSTFESPTTTPVTRAGLKIARLNIRLLRNTASLKHS